MESTVSIKKFVCVCGEEFAGSDSDSDGETFELEHAPCREAFADSVRRTMHTHGSRFSGRDLLDAVYGIADRHPIVLKSCACGNALVVTDARIEVVCPSCAPAKPYGDLFVVLEDFSSADGRVIVPVTRKGNRTRKYEFHRGQWFELDHMLDRLPKPVVKVSLLTELNRRGKVTARPPVAELRSFPRPFTRFVRTARGRVAEYPSATEPECSCPNEELHEFYDLSDTTTVCPRHGLSCVTCGELH